MKDVGGSIQRYILVIQRGSFSIGHRRYMYNVITNMDRIETMINL
jgi:hypothetical protein